MSEMPIVDDLSARGLVYDVTNREELSALSAGQSITLYAGYDPTSSSLHVGNLVPTIILSRMQKAGHRPIAVLGGATGMIGDPSGKSDERQLLDSDTLEANCAGIRKQLERFFDFEAGALMVNNADWFTPLRYIEFLRDIGKLLTINYMIAKDSVRSRLEDREQGISYTEFSYMLLQAYDFVHLAETHGCRLQVGGSDQWGNITAGVELQRKLGRTPIYGLVGPLLLDASGEKMGKTASGMRIWLDPDQTSPYAFYQYWLNRTDDEVERFLKIFSPKPLDEIANITKSHREAPHERIGQRTLAEEMTLWVHGKEATRGAIAASEVMFGGSLEHLKDADLKPLLADIPSSSISRDTLSAGIELIDLLTQTNLAKSKGNARRLVKSGGVYVNNLRIADPNATLTTADLGTESMIILRAGKKKYHLISVS
ncbi:MAG: tyrosine--tRNA ligase [Proteobacteria bacterium]|nr:tyrosine--tRNA ligase [Pseudomonadota bacterium]